MAIPKRFDLHQCAQDLLDQADFQGKFYEHQSPVPNLALEVLNFAVMLGCVDMPEPETFESLRQAVADVPEDWGEDHQDVLDALNELEGSV